MSSESYWMVQVGSSGLYVDPTNFKDGDGERTYLDAIVVGGKRFDLKGVRVRKDQRKDCSVVHLAGVSAEDFRDSITLTELVQRSDIYEWAEWVRTKING